MTSHNPNFIGTFHIDSNLCSKIIEFFNNNESLQSKGQTVSGLDETRKKSIDITINPKDLIKPDYLYLKAYFDNLFNCYSEYRNLWPFLNEVFEKVDIGSFNIQKYLPGGHFNNLHSERTSIRTLHRLFAFMTYLNDDFDAGETIFEHYSLTVKPEKGKTLIWPAEWTHAHKGNVVNNGSKYIITGWLNIATT